MAKSKTIHLGRSLRRTMTPSEVKLWAILKERPHGLRVRRQHPIGDYVLDFYHPASRTAIEVDGMAHDMGDRPRLDAMRDRWLAARVIATLRIAASDVMRHPDEVLSLIVDRCAPPLHRPSGGPPPHPADGED